MYLPSSSYRVRPADSKRSKPEPAMKALSSLFQLPQILTGRSTKPPPAQISVTKSKVGEQHFSNPQRAKSTKQISVMSQMKIVDNPALGSSDPYVSRVSGKYVSSSSILSNNAENLSYAGSSSTNRKIAKSSKIADVTTSSSTDNSSSTVSTSNSLISRATDRFTYQMRIEHSEPALPDKGADKTGTESTQETAAASPPGKTKALCCDKCDGKHETDQCPYYKKKREDHPDAQRRKPIGGTSTLPGSYLTIARVAKQPGDGSCLFHSISYGLNRSSSGGSQSASSLRQIVSQFIRNNPTTPICDTPIQDWVKWDSGSSVSEYSRRIAGSAWGGGIEMACLSLILSCNIHVYERHGVGYRRISAFDCASNAEAKPIVRVLYCGGVHYDALVA